MAKGVNAEGSWVAPDLFRLTIWDLLFQWPEATQTKEQTQKQRFKQRFRWHIRSLAIVFKSADLLLEIENPLNVTIEIRDS